MGFDLGSVIGGALGLIGTDKASDASSKAAKQAADVQRYIYDTSRSDYAPYRDVGVNALNQLAVLYGLAPATTTALTPQYDATQFETLAEAILGPKPTDSIGFGGLDWGLPGNEQSMTLDEWNQKYEQLKQAFGYPTGTSNNLPVGQGSQASGMDAFYKSPGYEFRLNEGISALDRSASARGRLNSGAQTKGVLDYSQGLASSEFGNYVNQLNNLAGLGQTATNSLTNAGQNYANNYGNALMNAGNSRASGYLGFANTIGNAINNNSIYNALNSGYGGYPSGYTDLMGASGYGNMF